MGVAIRGRQALLVATICLVTHAGCGDDGGEPVADASPRADAAAAVCGDGDVEGDETCDDGNAVDDDGCDADCVPSGAVQVAAGGSHSCVLLRTGNVKCWGDGGSGRLGQGSTSSIGRRLTPRDFATVEVGGRVVQIAAGGEHTCALLDTGAVHCWGDGLRRAIGTNSSSDVADSELTTPAIDGVSVVGGAVSQISAGSFHTCARLAAGTARCWGLGLDGQLGYASEDTVGSGELGGDITVGGEVALISAGIDHTCGVLATGTVRCWGSGVDGALGYGNEFDIGDTETPALAGDVDVGGSVAEVGSGFHFSCARLDAGTVRCWGAAQFGRLGYGNATDIGDTEAPAAAGDVDIGGTVTQLSVGGVHSCALLSGGQVRCWGLGLTGRLGYASTNNVGDAAPPSAAGDVDVGGTVVHIAAGGNHTCAVLDTGAVRCWGQGGQGQLGYGNVEDIGDTETPAAAGDVPLF